MVKIFRYILAIAVESVADGLPTEVATVVAADGKSSLTVVN